MLKILQQACITAGKFADAGKWYGKILTLNHNYGKVDLYYAGYNDYRGGNYKTADSVFTIYQKKYPEMFLDGTLVPVPKKELIPPVN